MFADHRAARRRIRTRYHLFDPNCFARYIGNLILMRALADKPHLRAQGLLQQSPRPACTPKRARNAHCAPRAAACCASACAIAICARFGIFMYALDDLDELARVLSPRLARRLTRLQPILTQPCAADARRSLATPEVRSADSS